MLEEPNVILRDMTLENPIRAIREISHDPTCRRTVRLANGREMSALDMQTEFLERALRFAEHRDMSSEETKVLEMWQHCIEGIARDPMDLVAECDWVAKRHLIDGYMGRHNLPLSDPAVALVDLQYHDVDRRRGLFYRMQDRGLMRRTTTDAVVEEAMANAPNSTRARLRGEFIKRAKERKRDYTVDWVHLKLNDQAQRTVLCKDPFRSEDERVQKLIDSL